MAFKHTHMGICLHIHTRPHQKLGQAHTLVDADANLLGSDNANDAATLLGRKCRLLAIRMHHHHRLYGVELVLRERSLPETHPEASVLHCGICDSNSLWNDIRCFGGFQHQVLLRVHCRGEAPYCSFGVCASDAKSSM